MKYSLGVDHRGRRGLLRASLLTVLAAGAVASNASAIERTFRYYRFLPTELSGDPIVQISEFRFFNGETPIAMNLATVTNSGGSSPGAEGPEKIADGLTSTKWLNFTPTAGVVFDFGSDVTVDRYDWATANDAVNRSPKSWTLEGSANGSDWELIDVVQNFTRPNTLFTYTRKFELKPTIIQSFQSSANPVILNGTEISLSWSTLLAPDVSIAPGGFTGLSASGSESITPPDNSDTTYTLTAASPVGSTNSSVTVRTVQGGVSNFRYVRFTPVKLRDDASANSVQLSELRMLSGVTPLTPVTATNPGGNFPGAEGPTNLYDDSTSTKWLDFNKQSVVFDFGTPVDFDGYYFATANDAPERDPVRWIISGSNDETTWTMVENMTAFDYPTSTNRAGYTADIPLPGPSIKPAATFTGNAVKLVQGEPLVLTWSTAAAATVTIDNGVGTVSASGSVELSPTVDTNYTLTATSAGGSVTTATFSVDVINPAITTIAYENFDDAGEEIVLLGSAKVINAFDQITVPANAKRLRLTDDLPAQAGSAWFAKKMDVEDGFQTFFDLQMITLSGGAGADGMSFSVQNTPQGNGGRPVGPAENGFAANALNIKFDSYFNGEPEPGAAFVQVRAGETVVATADLTTFASLMPLPGISSTDLTMNAGDTPPYQVRVDYVPGDLDVYFNNVLIIDSADVDLASIGAVDSSGKAYVGFSGRTGGLFEAHDVTRWTLTEGPPPAPSGPLDLKNYAFDFAADTLQLTWGSSPTKTYRVTASTDLTTWTTVLASGIPGAAGTETTTTVNFTQGAKLFFRVEEE